jgi:tetratricopeptide (TPR) repeat protein
MRTSEPRTSFRRPESGTSRRAVRARAHYAGAPIMRRALLACVLLVASACHKPKFPPVLLEETRSLDQELLDLVRRKADLVRADPSDAKAHATLGLVYEANNLWEQAEESFAHAIAIDDSQPAWQYHHALALLGVGRVAEGVAEMREAARRMPDEAGVQQRVGLLLLDAGDVKNARPAIERAFTLQPQRVESLTAMARLQLASENWNEALRYAQLASKSDPTSQPAQYAAGLALQALGRDDEARAHLVAGKGATPSWMEDPLTRELLSYRMTTNTLVAEASRANAARDYARSAQIFERLVARDPGNVELLNNLAANLIELDKLDRAAEILAAAEARAPDSFAVQLNLAEVALKRQDLAAARTHAERAVALGDSVGRTHFSLARVLAVQKDMDGAYRELKRTVELDARNPQAFVALAEVSIQRNQIEEARKWCRKALELDPSMVPTRVNQCALALRVNDMEEAREALAHLEKLAPNHPRTVSLRQEIEKRGQ